MSEVLWTLEDLEGRWKPTGKTALARRKWVQRRVRAWGVKQMGMRDPRFRPADVLRAEEKQLR